MDAVLIVIAVVFLFFFAGVVFIGAPYVPSKKKDIRRALTELYPISDDDCLVDLGSGDGVVLAEAAKKGAIVFGVEFNPFLVMITRMRVPTASVVNGNMWTYAFPDKTTVVYVFSEHRNIAKVHRRVEQEATRLGRSLFLISYGFDSKDVQPIKTVGAHHLYKIDPLHNKKT